MLDESPQHETRQMTTNNPKNPNDHNETNMADSACNCALALLKSIEKFMQKHKKMFEKIYVMILGIIIAILIVTLLSEQTNFRIFANVLPLNNWKFQMANACLLLSYVSSNILFLRIVIGAACFWFVIWAVYYNPLPIIDTVMWNFVMMLVNLRHAITIFYNKRHIAFEPNLEKLYLKTFKGIVTRTQFQKLTHRALIREYQQGR